MGDVNELSSSNGKSSQIHGNSLRYAKFNNFILQKGLTDLRYLGLPFTWCKTREAVNAIFERLDRAFVNYND